MQNSGSLALDDDSTPPERADGCCEVYFVDADRVARARDAVLGEDLVQQVADTFKLLGHPSRIRILRALSQVELCVCDLAEVVDLSISATSHQLRRMREARLVRYRMAGKLAYYSVRSEFVVTLLEDAVHRASSEDEA